MEDHPPGRYPEANKLRSGYPLHTYHAKSHALDAVGVAHNHGSNSSADPSEIGTDALGDPLGNTR